jgi:hypothetical protein
MNKQICLRARRLEELEPELGGGVKGRDRRVLSSRAAAA